MRPQAALQLPREGAIVNLGCITNYVAGRSCTIAGEHLSTCRGFYLGWGGRVLECGGCLPQPATRHLLCESCFQKFEAAIDLAVDLVTHLRSVERGPVPDGPRSANRPGSKVLMPVSWMTADDVWAALRELAFRADPAYPGDHVGASAYEFRPDADIGTVAALTHTAVVSATRADLSVFNHAELAVRFYGRVQTALARFPIQEYNRVMPYAKCRNCGCFTLERRPPLQYLDPITVLCINEHCQWEFDPNTVEVDLAEYRARVEAELVA
jgi:hypothetical protein